MNIFGDLEDLTELFKSTGSQTDNNEDNPGWVFFELEQYNKNNIT